MIIVMKEGHTAGSDEVSRLVAIAESYPDVRCEVHEIAGVLRSVTEIYLLGSTAQVPVERFDELDSVERAVRIATRYKKIGRHEGQVEELGFTYKGLHFSQDTFHLFPGLCAVDTPEHVEQMFQALKAQGIQTTRAGAYKPRTSPYAFQGHGKACLPYLFELAGKYDIKIISMEVCREHQVDEIRQALDKAGHPTGVMLQIGTRNAQNFGLLKVVGEQKDFPVLFKRGFGISLEESLNAVEYVASSGNHRIIFCLRGMRTHLGDPHRNMVDFAHVPVVKRLTRLPVCIDPSHSVGSRKRAPDGLLDVHHVTAQGIIAGANMALVDFHPCPDKALCDGPQAMLLPEFEHFVEDCRLVRHAYQRRLTLAREKLPHG